MKPDTVDIGTGHSLFPAVLAVAFVAAVIGSWIVEKSAASAPAPAAAPATPAPAADATTPAATPTPTPAALATTDEVKGLKGEVDALAKKLDSMPKPDVSAEIKPIQEKLDAVSKSVEGVTDLPKTIDTLKAKLADDDKAMASLKDEIAALKAELASAKEAMKAAPAAATPEAAKPAVVDAAAMTPALDLFKAGKYADALAAFKALPATDARVLYFTALSNGLASNDWKGDTEQIALKGVDREKAGSPPKADIDAAVAGLTPAQGKAWLDFFRAKAK
jgi:TolA-binding protein